MDKVKANVFPNLYWCFIEAGFEYKIDLEKLGDEVSISIGK